MTHWFVKNKYVLAGAAAAALLTVIVFLPAVRNDYLLTWDDDAYVRSNPYIRSFDLSLLKWAFTTFYAANYWHPLTWLSHAVDYAIWGSRPFGHHLSNVLLHGLNVALVVMLLSSLLRKRKSILPDVPRLKYFSSNIAILISAIFTGLLFGIHPLRAESVVWIAERKDVLCIFFTLLSLWSYVEYVNTLITHHDTQSTSRLSSGTYLASLAFLALALMSKPMAVTVPAILLLLDWSAFRRPMTLQCIILEKIPFYLLSLASALISAYAKYSLHDIVSFDVIPLSSRILTGFHAIIFYLVKILWPVHLLPFYPYPGPSLLHSWHYLVAVILVAGVTVVCVAFAKRQRLWLGVWSYYLVTLLPILPFMLVGEAPVANRFSYLPSLGPIFLLGFSGMMALDRLFASTRSIVLHRLLPLFVLVAVLFSLMLLTIRQIDIQRNDLALWSYEIETMPAGQADQYLNFYLAYSKRGLAFADSGRVEDAVRDYEQVLHIRPDFAPLHVYTGILYHRLGRYNEAVKEFRTAVTLDPADADAHRNLGIMYFNQRRMEEAIQELTIAVMLRPDMIEGHFALANIFCLQGKTDGAIEHYQKALAMAPNFIQARNNLGFVYLKSGRVEEAIKEFRAALLAAPDSVIIHNNLAVAYLSAGDKDEAAREYEDIKRIDPNFVPEQHAASSLMMN